MTTCRSTGRLDNSRSRAPVAMITFFGGERSAGVQHLHGSSVSEDAHTLYLLHSVFLEEHLHAAGHALHHLTASVDGLAEVIPQVVELDAEVGGLVEEAEDLGVSQQGLAGNAPPVEANAAHGVPLNQRGLHAQLARTYGGHVAAGARPHYYEVVIGQ